MLPNDLFCLVPSEAFGRSVPAEDVSIGIQHEERVVPHPIHQQAEPLFALAQPFLVLLGFPRARLGSLLGGAQRRNYTVDQQRLQHKQAQRYGF